MKLRQIVEDNDLPDTDIIFVEVTVTDPSDFAAVIDVHGQVLHGEFRVICLTRPSRMRWPHCCCTSGT